MRLSIALLTGLHCAAGGGSSHQVSGNNTPLRGLWRPAAGKDDCLSVSRSCHYLSAGRCRPVRPWARHTRGASSRTSAGGATQLRKCQAAATTTNVSKHTQHEIVFRSVRQSYQSQGLSHELERWIKHMRGEAEISCARRGSRDAARPRVPHTPHYATPRRAFQTLVPFRVTYRFYSNIYMVSTCIIPRKEGRNRPT